MTFRCLNRFDNVRFVYTSDHPAGTPGNAMDAVREWNGTHSWYRAIGAPCVVEVVEIRSARAA